MNDLYDIAITLLSSGMFGVYIAIIYRLTHSRAVLSSKMSLALIMYAVLSAMLLYLKFAAGGIALIGIVSIVRFRSAIKDHRDIVYVLWAIFGGVAAATHMYGVLGVGSIVITLGMMLLGAAHDSERVMIAIKGKASGEESIIQQVGDLSGDGLKMKFNNSVDSKYTELIYEISKKNVDRYEWGLELKNALFRIEEIDEIDLFYQNDDMAV